MLLAIKEKFESKRRMNSWKKEFKEKNQKREKEFEELMIQTPEISSIKLKEHRVFYDTKWSVSFLDEGELKEIDITRDENESNLDLIKSIKNLDVISFDSLKSLDLHDKIYYD